MKQTSLPVTILQTTFVAGFVTATAVIHVPTSYSQNKPQPLHDNPKQVLDEAWQLVNRHYVDENFNAVDWQAVRQQLLAQNYTSKTQAYNALRQALSQLQDPYTRFMDPEQFSSLTSQTAGQLSGIGIRLEKDTVTQVLTIVEPLPNSPALKAGLKPGDRILAIDGRPTQPMDVETASAMIRGRVGSSVKLQVGRDNNSSFDISIQRAMIALSTVSSQVHQEGDYRIGYIHLREFTAHATEQTREAIEALKADHVDAFVLDLRGNPGGLMGASIDIAQMWLNQGLIVQTVDRQGNNKAIRAQPLALTDLPLAILVDNESASSSEILAGALKDNHRAQVIGSPTFGKALVQGVHELSDESGLTITIARYYTPNGTDINHKGIVPDVSVALTPEQLENLARNPRLRGTANDPYYMRALQSLQPHLQSQANPSSAHRPSIGTLLPTPEKASQR
ncbi:PDZ domain-containing protein [Synechococcales cyanobacterium C]|uniref:PDZ domain-containing protein n=1 Tax=Petrachloros mirabilis ULC683 TaxID=2781853 RepID=A0A8K2A800_9CYAN|nr:S41 family peptidase [Petrachloros mirabilis]NCJ06485.1 PDZ domain-containing protein [Petrachloros mirabilis ULC683]